jgi:hypothetical protein
MGLLSARERFVIPLGCFQTVSKGANDKQTLCTLAF